MAPSGGLITELCQVGWPYRKGGHIKNLHVNNSCVLPHLSRVEVTNLPTGREVSTTVVLIRYEKSLGPVFLWTSSKCNLLMQPDHLTQLIVYLISSGRLQVVNHPEKYLLASCEGQALSSDGYDSRKQTNLERSEGSLALKNTPNLMY